MTIMDEEEKRALYFPGREEEPLLPRGFMMAVAQNMHAMETYAALTDEQRKRVLYQAQQTRPGEAMSQLVQNMAQFATEERTQGHP